jgi:glycosyltransferase involved in cell wall biosynthesis
LIADGKLPVTVVVPVKNEAAHLAACLMRLDRFAHVLVVDSASSDDTAAIARSFGAEVVQFAWNGRFPKKRNWILENHAFQTDWVLFLDADEHVSPAFVTALQAALPGTDKVGFWLTYSNNFMGRPLRFGVQQRKLALFRRDAGRYERIEEDAWSALDMEVHEHPVLAGEVGKIREKIDHRDDRGLSRFLARHNAYSDWEANRYLAIRTNAESWATLTTRQRIKYAALDQFWFGWAYFVLNYIVLGGFLDGKAGWAYASNKAFYFRMVQWKIAELRRLPEQPEMTGREAPAASPGGLTESVR